MFELISLTPFTAKIRGSFRKSLTVEALKKGNVSDIDLKDRKNEPFQYALDQNQAIGNIKRDAKKANINAAEKSNGNQRSRIYYHQIQQWRVSNQIRIYGKIQRKIHTWWWYFR